MYSSLKIWPTSTNPANFIPVIVQYFPFENYDSTFVYTEPPECCPYCKRYIDKHTMHEGENKYKCAWCSKTFKSSNVKNIESQICKSSEPNNSESCNILFNQLKYNFSQSMEQNFVKSSQPSSMIYRQLLGNHNFDHRSNIFLPTSNDPNLIITPSYCYTLFFVIDTCVHPEKLETLKEYLLIAIKSLKPMQSFILVVIHKNYISYVFTIESEQENSEKSSDIFTFNFSYKKEEQKVFRLINLRNPANYVTHYETLEKFIKTLKSSLNNTDEPSTIARKVPKKSEDGKNPIDHLIQQLNGDDHLFSEIVLFSTNGPTQEPSKQIFIDFVSPDSNIKSRPLIDGYFICSDIPNPKEQIQYMIEKIGENPVIFNVEINAYVTNYRFIQNSNFTSHFTQFSPFSALSSISSSSVQPLSNSTFSLVPQVSTFYSTANPNFSVSFQLFTTTKFTNAFNLFSPSYLGIETTYIKFFHNNVFKETIWTSRVFKKSSDFIPTITTVNPYVLIPYLCVESAFNVQAAQNQKLKDMKRQAQSHLSISVKNQERSLVESFVLYLIKNYRYLCIVSIPGKFDDFTFSTVPELQWFLRILFEHLQDYHDIKHICNIKNISSSNQTEYYSNDIFNNDEYDDDNIDFSDSISMNIFENHKKFLFNSILHISCGVMENFARYYPSISFWNDENNMMISNCPFDLSFYESVGSPPIVLIDTLLVLFIFSDDYENICQKFNRFNFSEEVDNNIESASGLNTFICKLIEKRFPKTIILGQPMAKFYKLLPDKNNLFACIKYYVRNNLLHKNE